MDSVSVKYYWFYRHRKRYQYVDETFDDRRTRDRRQECPIHLSYVMPVRCRIFVFDNYLVEF